MVVVVVGVQVQWHGEHGVMMMVQAGGEAGRTVVVIGARGAFVLNGFVRKNECYLIDFISVVYCENISIFLSSIYQDIMLN